MGPIFVVKDGVMTNTSVQQPLQQPLQQPPQQPLRQDDAPVERDEQTGAHGAHSEPVFGAPATGFTDDDDDVDGELDRYA